MLYEFYWVVKATCGVPSEWHDKMATGHFIKNWYYRTDFAYSVGVMPNFSLNWREK